jgi:ketosteroid isomerase-like protein
VSDSTSGPQEQGSVARTPEELHELFLARVNARDHEGLMALYADECAGSDLDSNFLPDKATISDFVAGFLGIVRELTSTTRKCLIAGDIALLSSDWNAVVEPEEGTKVETQGRSAEVARRQPDGSWRFVIDAPTFAL